MMISSNRVPVLGWLLVLGLLSSLTVVGCTTTREEPKAAEEADITLPGDPAEYAQLSEDAMRGADAVLMVGARFNWMFQLGQRLAEGVRVAQIDVEPEEFHSAAPVEYGLVADVRVASEALNSPGTQRTVMDRSTASSPGRYSFTKSAMLSVVRSTSRMAVTSASGPVVRKSSTWRINVTLVTE